MPIIRMRPRERTKSCSWSWPAGVAGTCISPSPAPVAAFRTATWWVSLWVSTPATTQGPSSDRSRVRVPAVSVIMMMRLPRGGRAGRGRADRTLTGLPRARIRSRGAPTGAGGSPAGRDADRSRPGQTPGAASQIPGHTPPPGRHLHSPRPNLLQRPPAAGSAVKKIAEYQRSSSRVPARFGPLQQIWTNGAATGPAGSTGTPIGQADPAGTDRRGPSSGWRGPDPACAMRARRNIIHPTSRHASSARHNPPALDPREPASHNTT